MIDYDEMDEDQIKKKVKELRQCGCLRCQRQIKELVDGWKEYKEMKRSDENLIQKDNL